MTTIPPAPRKPWPVWLPAVTRLHFGIAAKKPPNTPSIKRGGWVDMRVWRPYERWEKWVLAGRPEPRPKDVWKTVPSWASKGELDFTPWKLKTERALKPADPVPVPPPPKPPAAYYPTVPSRTVGKNGLYFYNPWGGLGPGQMIQLAKQHNLWIAVLVNETDRPPMRNDQVESKEVAFALRDAIHQAGLVAVASGWAEPFGDLNKQAAAIGELSAGFDEYMLNIEAGWVFGTDAFNSSYSAAKVFAPKVRAALGGMPLSLSIDWGNPIHFRPWLDAGCSAVRVQCYLNEWTHKVPGPHPDDPAGAPVGGAIARLGWAQADLPNGVPASMREVTYGKYGPASNMDPLSNWSSHDDAFKRAGGRGRSVWAAEFCDAADVHWLAR